MPEATQEIAAPAAEDTAGVAGGGGGPGRMMPVVTEEQPSGKLRLRDMAIGRNGINFTNAGEVMAFARMMADSDLAVRKEFRGNPGACLAVIDDAIRFGMSPYALARKAYFVNGQLAYEAQVIAAIINTRAPIKDRIAYRYEGEGMKRVCVAMVTTLTGQTIEHRSPPFAAISPKNSPLWVSDPDQQHGYYTGRAMCRLHFPEVLLGVYDLEEAAAMRATDVTPGPKRADFSASAAAGTKPTVQAAIEHRTQALADAMAGDTMAVVSGGGGSGDAMVVIPRDGPPVVLKTPAPADLETAAATLKAGGVEPETKTPPVTPAPSMAEVVRPMGGPHDIKANLARSAMGEIAAALALATTPTAVDVVADEFKGIMESLKKSGQEGAAEVMGKAITKRLAEVQAAKPAKAKK